MPLLTRFQNGALNLARCIYRCFCSWAKSNMQDDKTEVESLHDIHMREVGRVAAAWAALEFQMDFLIWKLAEVEQMLGACITTQLTTTSARIRVLVALLRLREGPDELSKALTKFDGRSATARLERNRIVHNPWATGNFSGHQIRVAIKDKDLIFGLHHISLDEIRGTYEKIAKLNDEFAAIEGQILDWLPSSPQKWRERLLEIQRYPKDKESHDTEPKEPPPQPPPSEE